MDTAPDIDTDPATETDPETPTETSPAKESDPTIERLDRIATLLDEVVDDNTAVTTSMNQLGQAQRALSADVTRELSGLRKELASGLAYRTLKDLCVELIRPLGAMEDMLRRADFTDTEAVSGHVQSLVLTLNGVLNRMGAERIPVGVGEELFNPARHRCVGVVGPDTSPFPDAPPRTIVRLLEDGYVFEDRLLSPVAVEIQADRPAEQDTATTADTHSGTAGA
ncbi:nucleotide exchange factor GrpE [Lentzea sp. BCCO 10_0856]|uniref:Nucleotide exchange factor GrpE n=1 Tax=Lentzea miocenica TaxID=3095431 RepID=A0ABU4TGS5_9PSEU|nr:nucleotide exchange factor GrpE [Lentzea sp. BCCO 10_0856]MDX8037385.1 nucleotide exchange factor GrpE [Lentzea sp. BCCO 10_0856]